METANDIFRLAHRLCDETFDNEKLQHYNLYLSLGNKALRLAVADVQRNKFVVLEDYELKTAYSPLQFADQVRAVAQQHPFLKKNGWNKVRLLVKNQQFTLIPATLFDPLSKAEYLSLHAEIDEFHDRVFYYRHAGFDAVNIFAVDSYLTNWASEVYQDKPVQFLHQTSALIEGVCHQQPERDGQKKMGLYVEKNYLTIVVVRDGALEFCNQFYYVSAEDFIYYTIFVMQEQKLNPEQDALTVWGDLTHDSELFNILRKYVRHVKLGKKPVGLAYSYKFDEVFDHRYFDLYSIHLCE